MPKVLRELTVMAKLSPRRKFIETANLKRLAGHSYDAMQLASTHDPDLSKELRRALRWCERLFRRVGKLELQVRRLKHERLT